MKRYMYSAKKLQANKVQISVEPGFWLVFSFALVCIPVSWLMSWIIAASIHEMFHLIALKCCKIQIIGIKIGPSGAGIEADIEPGISMIFCALAGPIAGFVLLTVVHIFPRVAICGLLQSLCNLVPIYPLDGSRIIVGVVFALFDKKYAAIIFKYIDRSAMVVTGMILCFAALCLNLGIMPLIPMFLLLVKKNFLANHSAWRYNMDKRKQRGYFYDRSDSAYFANCSKTGPLYRR